LPHPVKVAALEEAVVTSKERDQQNLGGRLHYSTSFGAGFYQFEYNLLQGNAEPK
jgi:hypothetical protein